MPEERPARAALGRGVGPARTRPRVGGWSPPRAETASGAFAPATAQELATKADLERVETVLRAAIENLGTELRSEIDGLRTELKGELHALEQRLLSPLTESQITFIKWRVPLLAGQTARLAAAVKLLRAHRARPQQTPERPPV